MTARAAATAGGISSLMHELRDAGLVENVGGEGLAGERWRLTPAGERVVPLLAREGELAATGRAPHTPFFTRRLSARRHLPTTPTEGRPVVVPSVLQEER